MVQSNSYGFFNTILKIKLDLSLIASLYSLLKEKSILEKA